MSNNNDQKLLERIRLLHAELGIPQDYAIRHNLEPCVECPTLASIGSDIFDREQRMEPQAAQAWVEMRKTANTERIEIQVISAFRSIDYQTGILREKLQNGLGMAEILAVSAAPGFSEHHTGRALDITTPGYEPLEEHFEDSPAFTWLQKNAASFGFRMSFPRDNPHGLCYEPWHWCWHPEAT